MTAAAAAVPKVDKRAWPGGTAGDWLTLTEMARRIRDGLRDPNIRALAGNILKEAGGPSEARARAEAIRAHMRAETMYAADPPMTEMIQAAKHTLCAGNALCIPIGDCDDHVVACLSLLGSIGLDVHILALDYGAGVQGHVMGEFQDDNGAWVAIDTTPPYPPLGYRPSGATYTTVDPLNPVHVPSSTPKGQFVGVGATAPSAIPYLQLALPATAQIGLRYRLGMQLTFSSDPTDSYRAAQETRDYFASKGWAIESLAAQGPAQLVPGLDQYIQSYLLQAIATSPIPIQDDGFVQYLVAGVQASSTALSLPGGAPAIAPAATSWNVSFTAAILLALGAGAAGGVTYYAWKHRTRRTLAATERRHRKAGARG